MTDESDGPDFSGIDSRAKAEELFRRGELEKLLLFPLAFGGDDIDANTLYVPPGIADIKRDIDDNVIAELVSSRTVSKYTCTPEYSGRSVVPIAIKIVASNPGQFEATIAIWGEALGREQS